MLRVLLKIILTNVFNYINISTFYTNSRICDHDVCVSCNMYINWTVYLASLPINILVCCSDRRIVVDDPSIF